MEAPLHHYPVPMPAPAPLRQHDAIIGAVLQQVSAATTAPNPPPPLPLPPPPPPPAVMGREQCPRCASRDTKFCYYNNYNTAQPRHFCRACRRYWTLGGSLRNVPVGGSSRKRPRPTRGGPTRAALAAAVAMTSSPSSAATTTTTTVSSCGPFTASPVPAPATVPAHQSGGGLLSSLLLGSVPLLEGRLGFGQPAAGSTTGAGNLAQLGFGAGPLLWPATTVLEGDRVAETPSWKSGDAALLPPPAAAAALWQELAAAGAGAPQLLL